MKIALLTLGTRGDVQPFCVLGRALQRRGHDVVLSTGGIFESMVRSYGLAFEPVAADFQAMMDSDELKKVRRNPLLAGKTLNKLVYPVMEDAFHVYYKLSASSDRVLFHIKTMADQFADRFPEKMIHANLIPVLQPTAEFPNPVFSFLRLPAACNRFTYRVSQWGLAMWRKPVHDFRQREGMPRAFSIPHLPALYGISEHFLPKPGDFPADSHFTGFWTEDSDQPLAPELVDFIGQGDPPLLITFGSMPFESRTPLPELVKSVTAQCDTRVIVVKGWGLKDTAELEGDSRVCVIDSAPYDKLMPLVSAVVHHGGIGTLAACMRAGVPSFICPVLYPMGDQHFWGTVAEKRVVALRPVPLKKMTPESFVQNIRSLLQREELRDNAQRLAALLAGEDGLGKAMEIIEQGC